MKDPLEQCGLVLWDIIRLGDAKNMQPSTKKRDDRSIRLMRMVLFFAAFLYVTFGFFMKVVLDIEDLIPLSHRLILAAALASLAGLSFVSSFLRQYLGIFTYGLGSLAVLHLLYWGSQVSFDAGSIVAMLLVIPLMNFLFFRWKLLLYGNGLLLFGIIGVFALSSPSMVEMVLFILSSAIISGVSFWFTRQLLLSEQRADDSEQLFRDLFHNSMDGIGIHELIFDSGGNPKNYVFIEANAMFETHIGLKVEDILGKKVTDVLPGIEETPFIKMCGQVVLTGQATTFEHFYEPLQRHFRITAYSMGQNRFAAAYEDITKQKKDQEEINKKNEFIDKIMKSLPNAVIYVFDLIAQKNIFVSQSLVDVLGYTPEEFQELGGEVLYQLIHPEDYQPFMDHLSKLQWLHKDEVRVFVYRMKHRNGDWIWMENRDSIFVYDESGHPLQTIGSAIDITDEKLSASKIEKQTALITSLLHSIPDLIFYKDVHGVYLGCNPAFAEHVGLSPEEIIGKTDYDLYAKEEADAFRENDKLMLELSAPRHNEEWIFYPDGRRILIDTLKTPYRGPDGQLLGILGISRDITERKDAEKKLAERDQLLTKLSQQVPGAIYQFRFHTDGASYFPFASDGIWDIYEVTPDEIQHSGSIVYSRIHPLDYDRVVASIRESFETLTIWNDEYRVNLPERGLRWVRGVARPEMLSDESVLWHGYLTDTTAIKEIEEAHRESEERFRALYENSPVSIIIHDQDSGAIMDANNTAYLSYGFSSLEELQASNFWLEPPYSQADALEWIHKAVEEGPQTFEWKNCKKTGEIFWEQIRLVPITINKAKYIMATTIDITDRIEAEKALEDREKKYKALVSNVPGVIFQCRNDAEWTMEFISHKIESITGYAAASFINNRERSYASIIHEDDAEMVVQSVEASLGSSQPYALDYRIIHADGSIRWIYENAQGIYSDEGDLLYIYGVITDVTEQKKTEIALRESEEKFRQISETMGEVFWLRNGTNTKMIYVNPAYETVWGRTCKSLYEHPDSFVESVFHEDRPTVLSELETYTMTGKFNLEFRIVRPSGELRWVHAKSFPVKDKDDRVIRHTGLAVDITERKQVEEKLLQYTKELELRGIEMDALYNALDNEMQNARRAHQRLVQQRLPQIPGISISVAHNPATFIGGDFSYALRKGDHLILYVSDITGHGLEGTIFGLFVKGCIESYLELTPETALEPDKILAYLDEQVHKGRYPSEYAVAIFMIVIDLRTWEMVFSSAGFHNPPALVHSDGSIERLVSQGLPISPDIPAEVMSFEHHSIHLPKDSFVFVATDGIFEQYSGEEMYEHRLLSALTCCNGLPKDTVADLIYNDFCEFRGAEEQTDDITFVVLSTESFEDHRFPSSLKELGVLREHALTYYRDYSQREAIALVTHELVVNAIEHGNCFDEEKYVWVQFSSKGVVVEDEGVGFNWRARARKELDLNADSERGRGIAMVQLLVGDLVYNKKGNRVSVILGDSNSL